MQHLYHPRRGAGHGDGYALIRAIREREQGRSQRTVAIAISGFAARQDREAALRAGYDDHFPKPLHLESLLDRVRKLETEHGAAGSAG
jgi:CheY-like chemotaxis protein